MIPMDTCSSKQMSLKQLGDVMFPLGFITYGGPLAHINVLRERFKNYTTEDEFQELFALCQTLPGPTSTQMVIAVGANLTHSCLGGLVAFLYFSMPSAFVMMVLGLTVPNLSIPWIQLLINGFKYASIGVIMEAAYKLSNGAIKNKFHLFLWIVSAIVTTFFPTPSIAVLMIVIGAIANYVSDRQIGQQLLIPQEEQVQHSFDSWLLGYRSLVGYGISFVLFFFLSYIDWMPIAVCSNLFKTGSLVIGGGHVVLPMIQFSLSDYLTTEQFWNAFALVSCMPGPMFNIAIYIGALIGGIPMAILAEMFMFLPGFFTIFGILPYWKKYRGLRTIRAVLQGIAAVAVGFILSAIVHLIINSCNNGVVVPIGIGILSCLCLYKGIPIPFVIIGGGFINLLTEYK
ncbi:unnamed protein product (macronuclear) [Paramecium tetraurelia]|uniref:Chromate transporter n=1 Tax=Paramecium tetraurelia TaxID=5888 RepID=A0D2A2_PARTE|nr:uncharacterized protein GSPATT00012675001 [Paramecium tetraurelia]CAK77169.1 unnamed protein product [Paramecium tetraurelia]|eukprot:XP_001444566.1 hypothetical protein (macronuclear) [Paramecium tetraurelia strain d4-2]